MQGKGEYTYRDWPDDICLYFQVVMASLSVDYEYLEHVGKNTVMLFVILREDFAQIVLWAFFKDNIGNSLSEKLSERTFL